MTHESVSRHHRHRRGRSWEPWFMFGFTIVLIFCIVCLVWDSLVDLWQGGILMLQDYF